MNTELRKKAKNFFEKYLFKLMNGKTMVVGKTTKNIGKYRDMDLLTTTKKHEIILQKKKKF